MSRSRHFQFLDRAARDAAQDAAQELAHRRRLREMYGAVRQAEARTRPGAASTAAIRIASGSARCTTTSRTGCSWCRKAASVRGGRAVPRDQSAARRCAAASARRIACAKAPARSTTASARSPSARSRNTSSTPRWRRAGAPTCPRSGHRQARGGDRRRPGGPGLRRPAGAQRHRRPRWCSTATSRSAACCSSASPASSWTRR
jgi:hypothetical protein